MSGSAPDWAALQHGISGEVLLPGSDGYERARTPFIAGFADLEPQAVVRCAAPEDVVEVIAVARRHGIHTATRSGGHSFAGYSSTTGIVIDVTPMHSVVAANGVAQVGAGARLGEMYERLLADGVTVPSGTCPSVGIGGITLGGGHGILGRSYGLTLDHLLGAQVVLADGHVAECDERHHADLLWALRGAGAGHLGVVTAFTFRTRPASSMTNFRLVWPQAHAAATVAAWQRWAPYGPDALVADLTLSVTGDLGAGLQAEVCGAMLGSEREACTLLDDLVSRAGSDPSAGSYTEMSFLDTIRYQAGAGGPDGQPGPPAPGQVAGRGFRFTKSGFFDRPLPGEAVAALVGSLTRQPRPGQDRSVVLAPWGGAYSRQTPDATAFAHRDQLFLLEHLALLPPDASVPDQRAAHDWMRGSWDTVGAWASGRVYPNFPDPGLQDWGRAYHGENHPRLLDVKARYDPDGVFRSRNH